MGGKKETAMVFQSVTSFQTLIFFLFSIFCYSTLFHLTCSANHHNFMTLRSSMDTTRLVVPKTNLAIGDRSFAVCAARAWNDLSPHMRTVQSVEVFKKNLKTFLF